jgi:hypothetical protein
MNNSPLSSWTVNQRGMRVTVILDHPGQSSDFRICRFLDNGYHPGETIAVAPDKRLALIVANCLNLHAELVAMLERAKCCAAEQCVRAPPPKIGDIHWSVICNDLIDLLAKAKGEANVD